MKFSELASTFKLISYESSRLKITDLLAHLLEHATPEEAQIIAYLSLGELRAVYQGTQFNLGQKTLMAIVQKLLNMDLSELKEYLSKVGDLGVVVERVMQELALDAHKDAHFSVQQVYDRLIIIEQISGTGSQEKKIDYLLNLLQNVDPLSASMILNIILGTLRLGFSDMTLLDALSVVVVKDKSLRKIIEHAYNVRADIGYIARIVREGNVSELYHMQPKIGVPVRPASAERATTAQAIIAKIGPCAAQPKLDGFRVQVHFKRVEGKSEIKFFSRNLQDMSSMFPDLVKAFIKCAHDQVIVEGEAIAYDEATHTFLPFQQTVKRKRKHDIDQAAQDVPLKLYLFDVLDIDGKNVMPLPHFERRKLLEKLFKSCKDGDIKNSDIKDSSSSIVNVIEERLCQTVQELQDYFDKQISEGLEGLVVKKPEAPYTPGKRNSNWIKLKRSQEGHLTDTLDTVVLGYNYGKGRRAGFGIGAILVGIYNAKLDMFQSIAKIGTGLSDQGWKELKEKCETLKTMSMPHNVQVASELYPDVWVKPEIVVEVTADEVTKSPLHKAGMGAEDGNSSGLALRFPRFLRYREDKSADQATTAQEVQALYALQYKNTVK